MLRTRRGSRGAGRVDGGAAAVTSAVFETESPFDREQMLLGLPHMGVQLGELGELGELGSA